MSGRVRLSLAVGALVGALVGVVAAAPIAGAAPGRPSVVPVGSTVDGHTYGEWSAAWWQWAYSMPIDQHPLFDTAGCNTSQSGNVWFLGATFQTETTPNGQVTAITTRKCKVPSNTYLFVPILNSEAATLEGNGSTEADLRAAAKAFQDTAQNMSISIDGVSVPNIGDYRVQSPLFTYGPLPANNVLASFGYDAPAGATSLSVGDGVYAMVEPLHYGHHTIHFHGEAPAFQFLLDITYNITVAPGHG